VQALPEAEARTMFAAALYPWWSPYSDGTAFSLVSEWGMETDEGLVLLGSPDPEKVRAYATYPRKSGATLLPFSTEMLVRLGYLFGVRGELSWQCTEPSARLHWLTTPHPGLAEGATPFFLLRSADVAGAMQVLDILQKQGEGEGEEAGHVS
jgi:hypothetical protein